MLPQDFDERLATIQGRIAAAAARAGRNPDAITLVAVTKEHPAAVVQAAYERGLRDFGENRVATLLEKQAELSLPDARWHLIGHVQGRKAREVPGHCDLLHSLDRLTLAEELSRRAKAAGVVVAALLQVNGSGEESKGGWRVHHPAGQDAFLEDVAHIRALPGLHVQGLMTMAPFGEEAEESRFTFATTRAMQARLAEHFPTYPFPLLSMGMTNDFEVAIEEGATHVRIGTALFGPRPP